MGKVINTVEYPFGIFGFQMDIARQIDRPNKLLDAVEDMGGLGYNAFTFYVEDAFVYPRHPGVARKHAYTVDEIMEVYKRCDQQGIELIPVIPALGHCGYIVNKPGYEKYDEGRGTDRSYGSVSPSFPETYELLRELFEDWCHHIPGKYLHVGLDESASMGQYQIRTEGVENFDAVKMFSDHCNRLNEIARSLDRQMIMWGDMFYHFPEALQTVDKDIIIADWYYYSFDKTPRIESFNFQAIDSSGEMKKAGFQVWGIPSVWPNYPFAKIPDRFQNLLDWIRYGKDTGIDGIINSEWENSFGFYENSDLLFRAFAKVVNGEAEELDQAFAEVLDLDFSNNQVQSLIDDILKLGDYGITAHTDRKPLLRSLGAMVASSSERHEVYQQKAGDLNKMFSGIARFIEQAGNQRIKDQLKSIKLCFESMWLYWNTGLLLSDTHQELVENKLDSQKAQMEFSDLAGQFENFISDYMVFWNERRYRDDPNLFIDWCKNCIEMLREWSDKFAGDLSQHPLLVIPRLGIDLICKHPALPVVKIVMNYSDGSVQESGETMINFDSDYSIPDKEWYQYPVFPCDQQELPQKIEFTVPLYGQVGIGKVEVAWNGKTYAYQLADTSGPNIQKESNICWLGPIGATPDDLTSRPDSDQASYILKD